MAKDKTLMALYDCHVHTIHSCDAELLPDRACIDARDRGLRGLVFTDHAETRPSDLCYGHFKPASALQDYRLAPGNSGIQVGYGLEITYGSGRESEVKKAIRELAPGFRIGAVHYIGSEIIDEWFKTACDLEPYFDELLSCASSGLFHCLAHLDYFNKITDRFRDYLVRYRPWLDEIIEALLDTHTLPEVNTSTLRRGLPQPMPGPDFLELFRKAGGERVYLGSDAHRPGEVGWGFDEAMETIRSLGLSVQGPPEECFI
ncbi:MAG: PHP domain-containing protein [candidate division WOR-3 bacterium]